MTPGQRAYEARCAAMVLPAGHWRWAWGKLDDATRAAEEAGAQAAIGESDSTALAQLAMAQESISDLAAERDRYRKALEELATPVVVTACPAGWLHDHGEDCEFSGCDAAELHYRIVVARRALEGPS